MFINFERVASRLKSLSNPILSSIDTLRPREARCDLLISYWNNSELPMKRFRLPTFAKRQLIKVHEVVCTYVPFPSYTLWWPCAKLVKYGLIHFFVSATSSKIIYQVSQTHAFRMSTNYISQVSNRDPNQDAELTSLKLKPYLL